MPKIALDEFGNKKIRSILGGRASILCYDKDPLLWQYRQKKEDSKSYIHRSMNEPDLAKAARRAEEMYLELRHVDKKSSTLISTAINEWIKVKEERMNSGQVTLSTVRGTKTSLQKVVLLYLTKYKKISKINQIKNDTFLDFSYWRSTVSWKLIERCQPIAPPKQSTIKRDLALIHDWYANFLIPRGFADKIPSLETIIIRQDQMDANPPIPLETDWPLIYRYFDQWSSDKEIGHLPNYQRIKFWRMMMRHFILVCYNSGCRPKELLGRIEKQRYPHPEGGWEIRDYVKGGLKWSDVEVEPRTHTTVSGKEFEFLEAVLYIRESKTGVPREIPTNTGKYFIRWRQFCDEFRKENALPKIQPNDYVFSNPFTERPYPYSQPSIAWDKMRINLSHLLTPTNSGKPYTLYSLRSSYITNQINEGKDVYLIKKITGHSLEVLNRHYDRSDVRKRRAEATARTYGAPKQKDRKVDLSKLDKYKDDTLTLTAPEGISAKGRKVESYSKEQLRERYRTKDTRRKMNTAKSIKK